MKEENDNKGWGIASLVTGILGLLLFVAPYFGLPLAIFAVVAGAKQNKINKNGMANAGKIMGIIGIVINAIMLILVAFVLVFMSELLGGI